MLKIDHCSVTIMFKMQQGYQEAERAQKKLSKKINDPSP